MLEDPSNLVNFLDSEDEEAQLQYDSKNLNVKKEQVPGTTIETPAFGKKKNPGMFKADDEAQKVGGKK